jgi:hypothetical protein
MMTMHNYTPNPEDTEVQEFKTNSEKLKDMIPAILSSKGDHALPTNGMRSAAFRDPNFFIDFSHFPSEYNSIEHAI